MGRTRQGYDIVPWSLFTGTQGCSRMGTPDAGTGEEGGTVSPSVRCLVHRDTYRDSVELMRVAAEIERVPGRPRSER